mgnify:CR=1 FL=1|jgi:hypothetical protein
MARNYSEDSRYESRYGGGWVAPHQILAEVMCERIAAKEKTSLPAKFWDLPRWKKHFLMQLRLALKLLENYHPSVISRGIRSNEGRRAFSFGAPFLKDAFDREQEKYNAEMVSLKSAPLPSPVESIAVEIVPRPAFTPRRSLKSRLEDLERE